MVEKLHELFLEISSGNLTASQSLLRHLHNEMLSQEEQDQVLIYFKKASRESAHAVYFMAQLYDHGFIVGKDLDMSFILMREAAGKGQPLAIYEVGHRFLEGIGVTTHFESALQWLNIAATGPHYVPDAMFDLGLIYEKGLGVPVDSKKAQEWFAKAAQKGHVRAQAKLVS